MIVEEVNYARRKPRLRKKKLWVSKEGKKVGDASGKRFSGGGVAQHSLRRVRKGEKKDTHYLKWSVQRECAHESRSAKSRRTEDSY